MQPRVISNALHQFGSNSVLACLAIFSAPYIVHHLGAELYGFLVLVGITTSNAAMLDLGLGEAAVKFIAEEHAARHREGLRRVFWTSLLAYLGLGVIAALGLIAMAPWLLRVLNIPAALTAVALQVFYLSAAGLVVSMLAGMVATVPRALERFDVVSRINTAVGCGQLLLSMGLLRQGYSIRALVAGGALLQAAALLVYALAVRRLLPEVGLPVWHFPTLRRMWRFGSLVTVSQVGAALLVHSEKILMSSLLAVAVVTYYTIPYNVVAAAGRIPWTLSVVLFPAFARLQASGTPAQVAELFLRSTRYVMLLAVPAGLLLALASRPFLVAWMGAEIAGHSAAVLSVLAIAFIVDALAAPALHALRAVGRPELPARYLLLQLALHIPLCFLLIRHYGVVGGAAAWLLRTVLNTILLTTSVTRLLHLGYGAVLRRSLLRIAAASLALAPLPVIVLLYLAVGSRAQTFGLLAAVGLGYVAGAVCLSLEPGDRAFARSLLATFRRAPVLALAIEP